MAKRPVVAIYAGTLREAILKAMRAADAADTDGKITCEFEGSRFSVKRGDSYDKVRKSMKRAGIM